MSKKGMLSMDIVVKYILAFAAFFVLALFIANFLGIIGGQGTEQACRTSVVARDKVSLGDVAEHLVPLNCPIQDKNLPETSVRLLNQTEGRDVIEKEIADLMAQCWWMYGNGLVDEVFSDASSGKGSATSTKRKACGVCYTFYIPTSYGNDPEDPLKEPITRSEFEWYLATHNYEPGLLQGGGALPTKTKAYFYSEQSDVPSSFTRELNRERLFASRRSLEGNIADLTNIYLGTYSDFHDLEEYLRNINNKGLQLTFIIVPEIVGEDFEKYNNLAIELIDEWNLGSLELYNGMVFVFSLQDGAVLYAAQSGADAILSQSVVEELIASSDFDELMEPTSTNPKSEPGLAILSFAKTFSDYIDNRSGSITDDLNFQKSYLSYITGGLVERSKLDKQKVETNIQGIIRWSTLRVDKVNGGMMDYRIVDPANPDSKDLDKTKNPPEFAIGAGYRYAILFFSSDFDKDGIWIDGNIWDKLFASTKDSDNPPSIALVFAEEIETDDYCRVYND